MPNKLDRDTVARLYRDELRPITEIGRMFGVSPAAVCWQLDRAGISRRPHAGANLRDPATVAKTNASHTRGAAHHASRPLPMDEVAARYTAGESTAFIAAHYGVTAVTISRKLAAFGHPIRPCGFSKWRTTIDGHKVQSGWEMLVDDWLFTHGITHTAQPKVPFGRNCRADFFAGGYYIEVWGVVHSPIYSRRKLRKLALYTKHSLPLIELYPRHIEREDFAPLHVLLP